ncbi:hypothetical protein cand_025670 [Cryptosporidium andersoni]|uniref:Uncharacterized protein n=1 Tax=Cryptosporidium andersoni TaxID=117008 RepID=A0A1J4MB01_9CRYT|nr:hypothetical protein cand_025670 [Cryptosporidium andersoni]
MNDFIKLHASAGRLNITLRSFAKSKWVDIFDQQFSKLFLEHPYVDRVCFVKPKDSSYSGMEYGESGNLVDMYEKQDPLVDILKNIQPEFYKFENVYPNSLISIPFVEYAIINNNGVFLSSPLHPVANLSLALFVKSKFKESSLPEILAVIRSPHYLYHTVINLDKLLKIPPHMKKLSNMRFFKIELVDKSYWNDKEDTESDEVFNAILDNYDKNSSFFNLYTNSLLSDINSQNACITSMDEASENMNDGITYIENNMRKQVFFDGNNDYICGFCLNSHKISHRNSECYCKELRSCIYAPRIPCYRDLSFKMKGSGKNSFYRNIQRQWSKEYMSDTTFLAYFDNRKDSTLSKDTLETILHLHGSPNARAKICNVDIERRQLIFENMNEVTEKKENYSLIFIDDRQEVIEDIHGIEHIINFEILESLFTSSNIKSSIVNSSICEQIIEYCDILVCLGINIECDRSIDILSKWDERYGDSSDEDISVLIEKNKSNKLLAPKEVIEINGFLSGRSVYQYIWYFIHQIACEKLNWCLVHIKGISSSPISFEYKPHMNDGDSGIHDVYILVFLSNNKIYTLTMTIINENDASL